MFRRLLNIASTICLVLCVALMGMWVRSYRWLDILGGSFTDSCVHTMPGRIVLQYDNDSDSSVGSFAKWSTWTLVTSHNDHRWETAYSKPGLLPSLAFDASVDSENWVLMLPYWLLVLGTGSLAIAVQLRWPLRFTLRHLFIATTFLAIAPGMIAWLDRACIGK